MAKAGQNGETLAEVLVDGLGLGRAFYDNNGHKISCQAKIVSANGPADKRKEATNPSP
jgi:hypothetical protein